VAKTKREPEEILDEEREQVLERVCAIDVAKDFGQVCVRIPRSDGRRSSKVFTVDAVTADILALGESLREQGVQMVTMESTSDYWRIFYYLLEACGLPVQLVNAREVKNVPGRPKTDTIDCAGNPHPSRRLTTAHPDPDQPPGQSSCPGHGWFPVSAAGAGWCPARVVAGRAIQCPARDQYEIPGCGAVLSLRRNSTFRVPSRKSWTRASSQPANTAWIANCAVAVNRSTFGGNRSGAYS
jgi:hypothetical protein